jgi:hypothetical protein
MDKYIYLSTTPEALISSMLSPIEFGEYMATGTKKSNKGEAIFFEVDLEQIKSLIDLKYLNSRCVTKPDGKPKSSVYLSVYRVLESIPLSALKDLYLTTDTGLVLNLKKAPYDINMEANKNLHLYQELCPVNPLVASSLSPLKFLKTLTDGSLQIGLPKLFFVDLKLGELAVNPLSGSAEHLPYGSVAHLRDCLEILKTEDKKQMKTVQRFFKGSLLYRTIESGFYIGAKDEILFYRYPSMAELEETNYHFFRSI